MGSVGAARGAGAGGGSSFRTGDVDEAREELDVRYYANRMAVVDRERRPFAARFDTVALGPLVIGDLSCGADVRMSFGELGAYHLNAPLTGTMEMRQAGGTRITATPAEALLLDPLGDTFLDRWSGDCRTLSVKIGAAALRDRLEQLTGRPPRGPLVLAPLLDITRGPGLSWVRFARQVAAEALAGEGLATHELVARPLQEALLNGLLLAAEHPWREALAHPAEARRPAPVKRVMDAVRERPEHPFTTTELAALARVSVRRLQESFREYVGMSPMAYVREVRLDRVREELRAAAPDEASVSEVAWRWGFAHQGRFAARYRERFGESPSRTLRTGR
ncbi:AraC family transcriptional regulator [Streptomyces sp. SP18ES09]|uniref:AraC family transcriptional regulator n=1 Tax=Streptomyces sp. SP18ES09 TaxID=3002532 RepID=UPI002E798AA9|nr:AraC family transcriptional regulator [Streptomyces sp. SP18ES09]MEE1819021.1 AraC family transcriptional regulator [Streptomyces sp. SP18ES09]